MLNACDPEIRMTARPPSPSGVAIAAMVSVSKFKGGRQRRVPPETGALFDNFYDANSGANHDQPTEVIAGLILPVGQRWAANWVLGWRWPFGRLIFPVPARIPGCAARFRS